MLPALTAPQERVFHAIAAYWRKHMRPPSYEDLRIGLCRSGKGGVYESVSLIEGKGYVARQHGKIYLTDAGVESLKRCPCCGRMAPEKRDGGEDG